MSIKDPFQWMESPNWQILHPKNKNLLNNTDHEILKYIQHENKYTEKQLDSNDTQKIFQTIWKTIPKKNKSLLTSQSNINYYQVFKKNLEYPILQIQKISSNKKPKKTIIDFNKQAHNHKFFNISGITTSPREQILSYAIDTIGNHKYTRYFYDIKKNKLLPFTLKEIPSNILWLTHSLIYYTYNEAMRANKLHIISIKNLQKNIKLSKLIYEEHHPNVYISISQSSDKKYTFLYRSISDTNEIFITSAPHIDQNTKWFGLLPMKNQRMYSISTNKRGIYVMINDTSLQYRVLFISSNDIPKLFNDIALMQKDKKEDSNNSSNSHSNSKISTEQEKIFFQYAQEIIPPNNQLEIESINITKDFISINYIDQQGLPVIKIAHLNNIKTLYTVTLPNHISSSYSYSYNKNCNKIYLHYQSLNCPVRIYEIKKLPYIHKQTKNLKNKLIYKSKYKFNSNDYEIKRIYVDNNNTQIPVTLVYKKNIQPNSKLLLNGYGAYGISYDLFFDNNRKYLLNNNWIIGYAHIRGGGELGDKWYYDGYQLNKKNTFNDFSAVIKHLIAEKYTSYKKLCIIGGSAGGLTIGNAILDHPNLQAAILRVPFLTPLQTMLNEQLPLTPGEYTEWGNPSTCKKTYEYIKSYDPYIRILDLLKTQTNSSYLDEIKKLDERYNAIYTTEDKNNEKHTTNQQILPNIYISAALSDPLVTYWEPLKYIAAIRELQKHLIAQNKSNTTALLNMEINASHKGKSGLKQPIYDLIKHIIFMEKYIK